MGLLGRGPRLRLWGRLGIPIALLLFGALVSGWIAWREAERARRTAQMLMKDYASFVADKFVRISANRYLTLVGISNAIPQDGLPFTELRAHAEARRQGKTVTLPPPGPEFVRYFFSYDAEAGALEFSGMPPPEKERTRLQETLAALDLKCGANQIVPLGRLDGGRSQQPGAGPWSALIETGGHGSLRRIYGLRLDEGLSIDQFFLPVITRPNECDCTSGLLPASLSHVKDARRAASFILRDGAGLLVYASEPRYDGSTSAKQPLSPELPFSGWTVEVAINPAVVQPLLPYAGRGAPWFALSLIGLLVLGSGSLAILFLRRETEVSRLRQDFISNVSHELKTPLARIRLFNELLIGGRQTDAAKRSRYREIIGRECRRLSSLVDNILDFSRLERGSRCCDKDRLDLRRTVEQALDAFRAYTDQGRFSLSAHLEDVPPVTGDRHSLEQVVINLLDNAVKYSPQGSPIELGLTSIDGVVRLSVTDHGFGIPKQEQERIFEPFYRVESGDGQKAAGSGLGLSLVCRTVEAHGGRVFVESEPGAGSTFVVEIPSSQR